MLENNRRKFFSFEVQFPLRVKIFVRVKVFSDFRDVDNIYLGCQQTGKEKRWELN